MNGEGAEFWRNKPKWQLGLVSQPFQLYSQVWPAGSKNVSHVKSDTVGSSLRRCGLTLPRESNVASKPTGQQRQLERPSVGGVSVVIVKQHVGWSASGTSGLSNNRLSSIYSRFLGFGQTVVDE